MSDGQLPRGREHGRVLAILLGLAVVLAAGVILFLARRGGTPDSTPRPTAEDATPDRTRLDGPAAPAPLPTQTGADALRTVAERLGLAYEADHDELPPIAPLPADAPPRKTLLAVAEAAGLVPVLDDQALADGRGGIHVTRRFLLAGFTADVADVVRGLDTDDPDVRETVLTIVGDLDLPLRTPVLGGVLLRDESEDVRGEAAALLGEVRDQRGVAPLVAALGDDDELVRQTARSSLLLYGDGFVRPALLDAVKSGPERVRAMARAILDENFGVPLDPDEEVADLMTTDALAYVTHDLEGMVASLMVLPNGKADLIVHDHVTILERRSGELASVAALCRAVGDAGPSPRGTAYPFGEPGLAAEPDEFRAVVNRGSERREAWGDLRGAPGSLRTAIETLLAAARTLPEVSLPDIAVVAREATHAEIRAAGESSIPIHSVPADDRELVLAVRVPGLSVPIEASPLVRRLARSESNFLVRFDGTHAEIAVIRARTDSGGR